MSNPTTGTSTESLVSARERRTGTRGRTVIELLHVGLDADQLVLREAAFTWVRFVLSMRIGATSATWMTGSVELIFTVFNSSSIF